MLPIPAPIIGSGSASVNHRRLFTALIYLGATASLCYVFLLALVSEKSSSSRKKFLISDSSGRSLPGKSVKYHHHHHHYERDPLRLESGNRTHHFVETDKFHFISKTKRQRLKDSEKLALSSSSSTQQTTQPLHFPRKKLHSLRRRINQNGAWRSDSAKIWLGHQDLKLHLTKGDVTRNKPSSEVYSYPWSKDEQCKAFKVQFAKKATFKPRALVSFPGSGNSWLRYMIECASGYYTGSVYDDKKLFTAGLLGELRPPNDGSTIVQKTHHDTIYYQPLRQRKAFVKLSELMFGYRGLLLIRNPYDALVSYWNFIKSERSHKGIAKQSEFEDFKWAKFVTEEIPRWTSLIISWLENSQDYLIILYEDVVKNPRGELIRILEYLDEPVETRRLDCLMKPENLEGHFHRPHQPTGANTTTSGIPLAVDLIPVTSTSQQHHQNIQVEHQNKESSSSHQHHHDKTAGLPLLPLDSKKSQQQHQQQHPQSPPPPEEEGEKEEVEQKEDKFLSPPPYEPIISSASSPSKQQQQNQSKDNMTSNDNTDRENHHHHHHQYHHHHSHDSNNHPNNSSILRLDLIIQDNIDKINRFFQQKGIPTQLHYSPQQSTIPFFRRTIPEYDV